jgi:hypothetical protein
MNYDLNQLLPPAAELFSLQALVERHPSLFTKSRLQWALRNRKTNGLLAANAVFETQSRKLLLREPALIAWYLKLDGRNRPRATRNGRNRGVTNAK